MRKKTKIRIASFFMLFLILMFTIINPISILAEVDSDKSEQPTGELQVSTDDGSTPVIIEKSDDNQDQTNEEVQKESEQAPVSTEQEESVSFVNDEKSDAPKEIIIENEGQISSDSKPQAEADKKQEEPAKNETLKTSSPTIQSTEYEVKTITVTKSWIGDKQNSVTVNILANGEKVQEIELNEGNDWTATVEVDVTNEKGETITYSVEEAEVPAGYVNEIYRGCESDDTIVVDRIGLLKSQEIYGDECKIGQNEYYDIVNYKIPETKKTITVSKYWDYYISDKVPVTINILANGEKVQEIELNEGNDWMATVEVDRTNEKGEELTYSVEEVSEPSFFHDIYRYCGKFNEPGVPPETPEEARIGLLKNQEIYGDDECNIAQNEYYEIYNYDTIPTKSITVTKTWIGEEQDSVTVNLLRNGEKMDEVKLSNENEWQYTFSYLPGYDNKGNEFNYTVEEEKVDGYTSSISKEDKICHYDEAVEEPPSWRIAVFSDSENNEYICGTKYIITNTMIPPTTPTITKDVNGEQHLDVDFEKSFNYNVKTTVPEVVVGYETLTMQDTLNDRLAIEDVKVLVDGEASELQATVEGQTVTLTLDRAQLDSMKGQEITLQIAAHIKDGTPIETTENSATIQLNDKPEISSETVTVKPINPTIDISVEKVWVGDKQNEVKVQLLADGKQVNEITLNDSNNWKYTFAKLNKLNQDGTEIKYSVNEIAIEGYEISISGDETNGFTITNTQIKDDEIPPTETDNPDDDPWVEQTTDEEEYVADEPETAKETSADEEQPKSKIPQLNWESNSTLYVVGAGFIILSAMFLIFRRKQGKTE